MDKRLHPKQGIKHKARCICGMLRSCACVHAYMKARESVSVHVLAFEVCVYVYLCVCVCV